MFVTNCSKFKLPEPANIPPQQRYLSNRIWYVHQLAKDAGEPFAVVSGEFGLVSEEQSIPDYEHMLAPEEIRGLSEKIAAQIKEQSIPEITFWVISGEYSDTGRAVHRYIAAVQRACELTGAKFHVMPITIPVSQKSKGETAVRPENIPLRGPHTMNKKAEKYVLMAQDENGIWQTVRKSAFLPDLQIKARTLVKKYPDRKVSIVQDAENFYEEYDF